MVKDNIDGVPPEVPPEVSQDDMVEDNSDGVRPDVPPEVSQDNMVEDSGDGVPLDVPPEVSQDNTGMVVVLAEEANTSSELVDTAVPLLVVNNDDTEEPIVFQSNRSIEELINDGPVDGNIEEEVRLDIHKLREHIFNTDDELVDIVESARSPYLREFLRQIRSTPASSELAAKNRCKK